jgi:transposase-like protein
VAPAGQCCVSRSQRAADLFDDVVGKILKVAGRWTYLYRAIYQHGQVIDVLLSERRDLAAARRFFTRELRAARSLSRSSPTG